jgi:hypothetical protein
VVRKTSRKQTGKPKAMANSDLKMRTKDYSLSVIRLFAELPKKTETQIMGRQLLHLKG